MNSKKALIELYAIANCTKCEHYSECNDGHGTICDINKNIILYDLERLEHIDKDIQLLMNKSLELSNKLTKYKKALDILKSKFIIQFGATNPKYHDKFYAIRLKEYNTIECEWVIGVFEECEKEEYELLKEVLEGEN